MDFIIKKENKKNKIDWIKYIFLIFFIIGFSYFLVGQFLLKPDVPKVDYDCETYEGTWNLVKEDGTCSPIKIPGKVAAKRNELVTIETTLPANLEEGYYLCFRSAKQDMKFYIDGKLREEYSTKNTRLFGKTSAVAYIMVEVGKQDAGKTLRVETKTDSSYAGIFYTVYYGNWMGFWRMLFHQYGAELVIAFITMILGVISVVGSLGLRFCYGTRTELEYLGAAVLFASIWLVTSSGFRQLCFSNISVVNDLAFLTIMILPFPFMIYLNEVQKGRYETGYFHVGILCAINFIMCSVLQMTNVKDFSDSMVYIALVSMVFIIFMGATIIIDMCKGYMKQYGIVGVGLLGALIAAALQFVMYFQKTSTFNGGMLAIGLIFLLVSAVVDTLRGILVMEGEKQSAILANKSKAKFLANMSHEIRTPINAVLGMNAMILRESDDMEIRSYAMDIQNAGQSLLSLINDILDFSKIESGKMEILTVEYDFSSVVHDIVNMISTKAEAKELTMQLFIDEKLPSRLFGDDVRLRQVLVNLLTNAVKYTEEGGVSLSISGECRDNTAVLTFVVEDTGIGIKEEDIQKLFEEFTRIEEGRNRNIEGTGLGINISVQLLNLMGSKLMVESTYGKGSKFYFTLAQEIADKEPIGNLEERIRRQATEYSYCANFTASKAKVLVVDDNAINRRVFVNLLKETRVHVDEASGGEECLELIQERKYHIIFLDHMMPEMDGIETLHCIKGLEDYKSKGAPIIALTANAISGAKEMYLREGFDDYLSKPINPDKLERMLMERLPEDTFTVEEKPLEKHKKVVEKKEEKQEKQEIDLPDLEGIDWGYALLHMNDTQILMDTVKCFYEMIDSEASKLEGFYQSILSNEEDEEALSQYRVKVHAMKSSAAMIGAVPLSGVAKMLEFAARDGKIDVIKNVHSHFIAEWLRQKEVLKPCIPEDSEDALEEKLPFNNEKLQEYFQLLKAAMEDMDVDAADEIVGQLKQFAYPKELQGSMEDIYLAVTNLDGELVSEKIDEVRLEVTK